MTVIDSIDPATGTVTASVAEATSDEGVATLTAAAAAAAPLYAATTRAFRAGFLRAIADGLEAARPEIVKTGIGETGLAEARMNGELTRTVYQARLFADVLEDGGYLEATIDHAGDTPMGPGPDLRRMLVPGGPVAVFGASNFPLAFSVPGGDTISALAAGCPVVLKAHSSHPALSALTFDILAAAASAVGAPDGVLGIVFGTAAGGRLVADPAITAVGFTGSLGGGKALMDIISRRPDPIPFYGELASLNPVVVTPGAASSTRALDIAAGAVASISGSGGQLCTKPGVLFVPEGADGDAFVEEVARKVRELPASTLLNKRIKESYDEINAASAATAGVSVVAEGEAATGDGYAVPARVFQVDAEFLASNDVDECFGPSALFVRYADGELDEALTALPPSLTATIHGEADEQELVAHLSTVLQPKAGRLLYQGFPTGVLVAWAQHHGGPWPSTNTTHTSVGPTSIRRWLRPFTWQDAPSHVLPEELRDEYSGIPRRVDGVLVTG
jgi:NADP-dependent aldehyde dehydrogenase